ncbi:MAG: APC family permease [Hyphomicrobiales bacterium]
MTARAAVTGSGETAPRGETALRRELGFWEVTASGVGIIVGAGIWVLIGEATADAGAGVWLSFVLAAVLSALTGLSYCELAALFPRASAEFEYTRHAFPEWVAFLVGWVMVAGLTVGSATVALGFARYLNQFVDVPATVGGLGILGAALLVAATGIKQSGRLTMLLVLVQVGGLLLVIAIGVPHIGDVNLAPDSGAGNILGAAALVFFAFIGFDEVITLSEETRDPSRTVPRALLAALAISTALYIMVAVSAVSVLGAEALGASPRPLADVMGDRLGGRSTDVVAFIAMATTANTTLLMLTASSRLTYGMARSRALPERLARLTEKRAVPLMALVACAAVGAAFVLVGGLSRIASVTDFAVYLVFLAVNAAVVVLRVREPDRERPFRVPFAIGRVPVLPVLGFASTVVMLTQLDAQAIAAGLGVVAAGAAVAVVLRRGIGRHQAGEPGAGA